MKKLIIGMGVLVAVVTLGTVVPGLLMDGTHVSVRTADYSVPPEQLWPVITDWQGNAAWRSDVERVEVIESREESLVVFHGPGGRLPMRITQMEAPERLVTQIADPSLRVGGIAYELREASRQRLEPRDRRRVFHKIRTRQVRS